MATTNIQTFSGDVEVTSNILMSGEVFIKANDGNGKVGIGLNAGSNNQGTQAIAVGYEAGQTSQGTSAVAVGNLAGQTDQGLFATALGVSAEIAPPSQWGETAQSANARCGERLGLYLSRQRRCRCGSTWRVYTAQGSYATAVGTECG
jgi:hypothetical protein